MKINRLIEIVIILLNKEEVTAKNLSDRFNVSVRTIYRDINELTLSGIPICTTQGKGGGISLMDNYTINRAMLSDKDKESLMVALKALQATRFPDIDMTFNKLGALFKNIKYSNWLEVDFSPWGANENNDNCFYIIKKGILENKVIKCEYINSKNQKSIRQLKPLKLIFKGRNWYIYAYCLLKSDYRLFKLVRMRNVLLTDKKFQTQVFELKDIFKIDLHNFINLHLRFSNDVLYRLYDDFDEKYMDIKKDFTDIKIEWPMDEWVYSYILSYGKYVKVLSPQCIQNEILKRLKKTIDNYK